ncbi:TetR/AcrR family transcriptional regulator [Litchfieldia alkalitelluris]|uniref:TetR/AcrR family transcriptional regulator n=1 Tax=Litchfieldia alkalitelluris TaxID=304268 RepID=UPI000996F14E|nr:TetR/AcrR family transcriptional regulator [Litchfieldia alkalitelluris]
MNDRKQHVIKMAHQLFIDRGFQATSIQDILEYSGISKGTFYNYFSSKNELLMALFKAIYKKMEKERNQLLIGQDPSDVELFIRQYELQMNINKENKLITLFEEVMISNDPELKQFIKDGQLRMLQWTYQRFLEIFGHEKKPVLLDCAIMFLGILHHNMKYYAMGHDSKINVYQVVRYSVKRVESMVNEVANTGEQLNEPELLEKWIPDQKDARRVFQEELSKTIVGLKKEVIDTNESHKYIELLEFIQEELLHSKNPRPFLIQSALAPLKDAQALFDLKLIEDLEHLISSYFKADAKN